MTVRLHPEATDDPMTLRWVTDATPSAQVADALIDDGTLASVEVTLHEIRTRLAPGRTWAEDGPRVRTLLFQSLSAASSSSPEDLCGQISRLVTTEVEPFVTSHGGSIQVLSVHDGVVEVALDGACVHCALRGRTLTNMVSAAVGRKFPQVREVRAVRP